MFRELTNDPFYIEYKKYDRCVLEYFIIKSNLGHKDVLLYTMNNKIIRRKVVGKIVARNNINSYIFP